MSKIKGLREERGWTQEHLGKLLGVQKATVSRYESDIVSPSNSVLRKLSSIFNVSTDYLLGNDKPEEEAEGKQHLAKYWRLNNTNRQMIDSLIEKILISQGAAV